MSLGMELKAARMRAGYTQQQASIESGVPLGTLRRWEQGVNEPDTDSLVVLLDLYGASADDVLGSGFHVAPALSDDEQRLLGLYRACDERGREYLIQVAEVTMGLYGGK